MPTALVIISCLAGEARGQNNSNPWPTNANVGIGAATNPQRLLNIHGVGTSGNPSDPTVRLSWHSSTDDAATPDFTAHLSLITSSYNRTMYSYCRDFFGAYQTTDKDLVLQADVKAGDIILANRCTTGYIRFATTPPPANPNDLQPGDLQDIERFAILPNGQVGVGTHSPYGKFDVNFGSWNCEFPKISLSNNAPAGSTGYTANPSIRFYAATGAYQTGDPPVPLTCDQYPARAWWLEAWNGAPGSFHIRSGVNTTETDPYSIGVGLETPVSRMSFLGNGNVGVNNESPVSLFQVTNGAVLFNGTTGATPTSGAGTRLMWIPEKAAFRAVVNGKICRPNDPSFCVGDGSDNYSDNGNIGFASVAIGHGVLAKGNGSIAMGLDAIAGTLGQPDVIQGIGHGAIAMGHGVEAGGGDAVCIGHQSKATWAAVAIGHSNTANDATFCLGYQNQADPHNYRSMILGVNNRVFEYTDLSLAIGMGVAVGTGNFLSDIKRAFAIGSGIYGTGANKYQLITPLNQTTSNSLVVGFNSDTPTMIVTGGDGSTGSFGKVGVGTITPQQQLDVNGSATVSNMVGIGTASPQEALSIVGTGNSNQVIIWSNESQAIPDGSDDNIDLMVEQKVVIGGSTVLTKTGTDPADFLLHVHGKAMKSNGGTSWETASDLRYKKDIEPFTDGIEKLRLVNPKWFRYNGRMGLPSTEREVGVIAQEVQDVLPYCISEGTISQTVVTKEIKRYQVDAIDTIVIKVADRSQLDEDGHGYKYIDSTIFIPIKRWVVEPAENTTETAPILTYNSNALTYVLVNSIKELDLSLTQEKEMRTIAEEAHKAVVDSLKLINNNQEERIARLEAQNNVNRDDVSDVILEQNNPNPFSATATITYYIPEKVPGQPMLVITTSGSGPTLLSFDAVKGIPTQHVIDAGALGTGVYVYSLLVQSKVLASKKMIVIK